MGNYRQHLTFASGLGVFYAAGTYVLGGAHWIYGTVAALLTTVSGLLPDLDSESGFQMRSFTGIVGVLSAAAVWRTLAQIDPPPAFEFHLWAMVAAYAIVRHGIRRVVSRFSVHRGMSHSFPTCGIWGALAYLYYPSNDHTLRLMMATAVMLGFFSHLLLDEMCSVDLKGARVNKAFGTAMKFWGRSIWSTLIVYGLLSLLTYKVVDVWPERPFELTPPPAPNIPYEARIKKLRELAHKAEQNPTVQKKLQKIKSLSPEVKNAIETIGPSVKKTIGNYADKVEQHFATDAPPAQRAGVVPTPLPQRAIDPRAGRTAFQPPTPPLPTTKPVPAPSRPTPKLPGLGPRR